MPPRMDDGGQQSRHSLQEDLADLTGGMLGLSLGPLFLVSIVQSFQDQDDHDQDADDHAWLNMLVTDAPVRVQYNTMMMDGGMTGPRPPVMTSRPAVRSSG